MDVEVITMPKAQAGQAFRHYRDAVRGDRDKADEAWKKEDASLMRAYKALEQGKRILDLLGVMKLAGVRYDDAFPRFAIARADGKICYCNLATGGMATFSIKSNWDSSKQTSVKFPADTFPRFDWSRKDTLAETLVPIVPPQLRPVHSLSGYHILWEVEKWKRVPPKDPMLLKHLGGWLYAIMAVWDLTPLERAVIGAPTRAN